MISTSFFNGLPKQQQPALAEPQVGIMMADGTLMDVLGMAMMEVSIGDVRRQLSVTVAEIDQLAIIGMDFLHATKAVINVHEHAVVMDGKKFVCKDERAQPFCARVVVASSKAIPAGHEALVPCRLSKTTNMTSTGSALIEPNQVCQLARRGLMIAPSLVQLDQAIFPLRVLNVTDQPITLKEGTVGGKLVRIKDDEIVDDVCNDEAQQAKTPDLPPHLLDLYQRSVTNITPSQHRPVADLLIRHQDIFSSGNGDIGRTNLVKHRINTKDSPPVRVPPRRSPVGQRDEIDRHVHDLLEKKFIEPSNSPWSSPVVLVSKKDGTKRFCVDYRKLNAVTVYDAYPIPRIDDSLDELAGAKWFSTLDLASGYWQIELDDDAKKKSAFTVRGGHYQWNVMPFGLSTAPATFERLMERVMSGLQWDILLVYLDDIIVHGRSIDEEIQRLETTFQRLKAAKLKLKPSKCHLFQKKVLYLGHVVSEDGVSTDPAKIEAVKDWPVPTTVTQVRSFIGTASYYRRFIQGFANTARPLHQLTKKSAKFQWTDDCQTAFETLRDRLITAPILAYPDFTKDFILDTDASGFGMGAVLSQEHDGVERVVAYGSKTLKPSEVNYCVTRRELLAVVFFLKKYKHYLIGHKVTVRTDHGALQWLFKFKDPDGQLARWLESLSIFQMKIIHRPGLVHSNADGLSRRPCSQCKRADCGETPDAEGAVPDNSTPKVRAIALSPSITNQTIREAQLEDKSIKPILIAKEGDGARPQWEDVSSESSSTKRYWSLWDLLTVRKGVLYRRWESDDGSEVVYKPILPLGLRNTILHELHATKTAAHLGRGKLASKIKQRYYWVGMDADVRSHIRKCDQCAKRKSPSKKGRAPLNQYQIGATMERVAMDLMGPLPTTHDGNRYILVIGDYWTKWMEAYPLPNIEATTVATAFVQEFVCRYGAPLELHTDQGSNFESAVFQQMCETLGIHKTRTTAYNPKSDGLIERFNKTLIDMVASLLDPQKHQRDWDLQLPYACAAYRSAVQASTGETPNMLMLGREVSLPLDVMTEAAPEDDHHQPNTTDYAEDLRHRLRKADERVRADLNHVKRRQKHHYDRKATKGKASAGDFVWLQSRMRKRGMSKKLANRWTGPYLVIKKLSDVIIRIQHSPKSKPTVVHLDRTKPYQGEPRRSWLTKNVTWATELETVTEYLAPQDHQGTVNEGGPATVPAHEHDGDEDTIVGQGAGSEDDTAAEQHNESSSDGDISADDHRRNSRRHYRTDRLGIAIIQILSLTKHTAIV